MTEEQKHEYLRPGGLRDQLLKASGKSDKPVLSKRTTRRIAGAAAKIPFTNRDPAPKPRPAPDLSRLRAEYYRAGGMREQLLAASSRATRAEQVGPRGGRYIIGANGKKFYIRNK